MVKTMPNPPKPQKKELSETQEPQKLQEPQGLHEIPEAEVVTIQKKLSLFHEYWSPKIIGELNDSHIKVAKLLGEFVWHDHQEEDEMFLVIKGKLLIKLRDRNLHLSAGDFVVIPKGVEHRPVAKSEVHVLLIEPKTTVNTGSVRERRTVVRSERI